MTAWSWPLLAPEASSEKEDFPSQGIGSCQLKELEGISSEGHEDQGEVPLRENYGSPGALCGEGGKQSSES